MLRTLSRALVALFVLAALPLLSQIRVTAWAEPVTRAPKVAAFDRQFIDMMVPHHQGAVAMAQIALKRGQHQQIKTLAQAIVASQSKEIGEMKSWRQAWYGSPRTPSMHQMPMLPGSRMHMMNMSGEIKHLTTAKEFDKVFIDAMIPHHESAVEAGQLEVRSGSHLQLKSLARGIIAAQQREIKAMRAWRKAWYGQSGMPGMGH